MMEEKQMKNGKKLLSILLAVVMVISALPLVMAKKALTMMSTNKRISLKIKLPGSSIEDFPLLSETRK